MPFTVGGRLAAPRFRIRHAERRVGDRTTRYGKPYPYHRQKSANKAGRMAANVLAYCVEGEKERVIAQDG